MTGRGVIAGGKDGTVHLRRLDFDHCPFMSRCTDRGLS
jgi:hypothetical protein